MTVTRRTAIRAIGGIGATAAVSGHVHAVGEHEDDEREAEGDDENEDDDGNATGEAAVRVAHFSPDAPNVDVYVDDDRVLADVPYGSVSDYLAIEPGTHTVRVTPSGEDVDDPDAVVFEDDVAIDRGFFTAAAIGVLDPGGPDDRPGRNAEQRAATREFTVLVVADGQTALEEADERIDEPTDVPPGATCPVCNMIPAQYPDWNAQAVHEDGERAYFCTSGCMTAYYVVPERFDAPDAAITGVWVTDFETRDLIDGLEATYVLETDADRVDDPMMRNPIPFADPEDATRYVDQYDDLDEDDVVTIEAFDRDVAEAYRARFLADDDGSTED